MKRNNVTRSSNDPIDYEKYTVGGKILKKWGFRGGGLGKHGQGMIHPIIPSILPTRSGLGSYQLKSKETSNVRQGKSIIQKPTAPENVQHLIINTTKEEMIREAKYQNTDFSRREKEIQSINDLIKTISGIVSEALKDFIVNLEDKVSVKHVYINRLDWSSPIEQSKAILKLLDLRDTSHIEDNHIDLSTLLQGIDSNRNEHINCVLEFVEKCLTLKDSLSFSQVKRAFQTLKYSLSSDDYDACRLGDLSMLLSFPSIMETIDSWVFVDTTLLYDQEGSDLTANYHHFLEDQINLQVDQFLEWRFFFRDQLSFESHGMWSSIVSTIVQKTNSIFVNEPIELLSRNKDESLIDLDVFRILILKYWNPLINLDSLIDNTVVPSLVNFVKTIDLSEYHRAFGIVDRYYLSIGSSLEPVFVEIFRRLRDHYTKTQIGRAHV